MRRFFRLDEAIAEYCGDDVALWPDTYKNVRKNGQWITQLTWYADEDGGKDSHDYIDYDGWTQWALNRQYGCSVKIVKDGVIVYN